MALRSSQNVIDIPSRNIIAKNTYLVNNNNISKVEISVKSATQQKTLGTNVFTSDVPLDQTSLDEAEQIFNNLKNSSTESIFSFDSVNYDFKYKYADNPFNENRSIAPAISWCLPIYMYISAYVPQKTFERYITNLDIVEPIKISKSYKKQTGFVWYQTSRTGGINEEGYDIYSVDGITSYERNSPVLTDYETVYSLPELKFTGKSEDSDVESYLELTNESYAIVDYFEEEQAYLISLRVICGLFTSGSRDYLSGTSSDKNTISFSGFIDSYILDSISITLFGDKITLSINESTFSKESDNNIYDSLSLSSSEIIQTESNAELICSKLLDNYKNGREYAEILCTLSNYSSGLGGVISIDTLINEANIKIISSNNTFSFLLLEAADRDIDIEFLYKNAPVIDDVIQGNTTIKKGTTGSEVFTGTDVTLIKATFKTTLTFEMGQFVRPYVCKMKFNSDLGIYEKADSPLSVDTNGTAKVFEIVGISFEYNGVAWQRLKLLEIPQDFLAQTIDT